jgi:hypothetical protein
MYLDRSTDEKPYCKAAKQKRDCDNHPRLKQAADAEDQDRDRTKDRNAVNWHKLSYQISIVGATAALPSGVFLNKASDINLQKT